MVCKKKKCILIVIFIEIFNNKNISIIQWELSITKCWAQKFSCYKFFKKHIGGKFKHQTFFITFSVTNGKRNKCLTESQILCNNLKNRFCPFSISFVKTGFYAIFGIQGYRVLLQFSLISVSQYCHIKLKKSYLFYSIPRNLLNMSALQMDKIFKIEF